MKGTIPTIVSLRINFVELWKSAHLRPIRTDGHKHDKNVL